MSDTRSYGEGELERLRCLGGGDTVFSDKFSEALWTVDRLVRLYHG